jgi:hypothetical protein
MIAKLRALHTFSHFRDHHSTFSDLVHKTVYFVNSTIKKQKSVVQCY